jgi:tryptophan synthase alpha chain
MTELENNRLIRTLAALRSCGRKALLPFLTAGYPDLETTEALLHEFARRGVSICELGFPFSDPIADGPVIQNSYAHALSAGVTSGRIFDMVRRFRAAEARHATPKTAVVPIGKPTSRRASANSQWSMVNGQLALSAMVSYSIIFRHGVKAFLAGAAGAGFDATIVPDLPLEEAEEFGELAAAEGLAAVLLAGPTTPPARRAELARRTRGFLYFMSVAGTTGERNCLPQATIDAVAELRRHTTAPICLGFGISSPRTVRQACRVADGAIVGSAIVRRISELAAAKMPRARIVRKVGDFVAELLAPLL